MDENRIIKVGNKDHSITLQEFADRLIAELRPISFTSKIFSKKGIVDLVEMERAQRSAIDRVIQRIRDEKAATFL